MPHGNHPVAWIVSSAAIGLGITTFLAESVEPIPGWAGAVAAIAVTVGMVCQVALRMLDRAEQRKANASTMEAAAKADSAATSAATEAERVKVALVGTTAKTGRKLDQLSGVAAEIHSLVNNNMAIQLELNAILSKRLAALTNDPGDARAAELATKLYADHQKSQTDSPTPVP